MKTKILAVLIVCFGILMVFPTVESENLVIPLDNSNSEDAELMAHDKGIWNDTNRDTNSFEIGWTISPLWQKRSVIWVHDNYLANDTELNSVIIELYIYDFPLMNSDSLNISVHELYSGFNESETTWNNRTNNTVNGPWEIPGGFYNPTPIYEVEIDKGDTGWHQFNITTAYKNWVNNGTKNNGIILICHDTQAINRAISIRSTEYTPTSTRPKLNITYSGGTNNPTGTSNITKDVWNLKGFSGDQKLASTIFSEISNCTAISYKNATSGYWYTYWPVYGLLEDEYLTFGDGLFILTSQNTTWDHT